MPTTYPNIASANNNSSYLARKIVTFTPANFGSTVFRISWCFIYLTLLLQSMGFPGAFETIGQPCQFSSMLGVLPPFFSQLNFISNKAGHLWWGIKPVVSSHSRSLRLASARFFGHGPHFDQRPHSHFLAAVRILTKARKGLEEPPA